jgi:hypothetical protein
MAPIMRPLGTCSPIDAEPENEKSPLLRDFPRADGGTRTPDPFITSRTSDAWFGSPKSNQMAFGVCQCGQICRVGDTFRDTPVGAAQDVQALRCAGGRLAMTALRMRD